MGRTWVVGEPWVALANRPTVHEQEKVGLEYKNPLWRVLVLVFCASRAVCVGGGGCVRVCVCVCGVCGV